LRIIHSNIDINSIYIHNININAFQKYKKRRVFMKIKDVFATMLSLIILLSLSSCDYIENNTQKDANNGKIVLRMDWWGSQAI
jgi:hypothetical protein